MMPQHYILALSPQHARTVLTALGELPIKQGIGAFDAVRDQLRQQDEDAAKTMAAPAERPVAPPPPAEPERAWHERPLRDEPAYEQPRAAAD